MKTIENIENTVRLYQNDVYQTECESTVIEVVRAGGENAQKIPGLSMKKDHAYLVLDQSVFFPTGGGQPCDLGSIEGIPVLSVWEREGIVYHEVCDSPLLPVPGIRVRCEIDWERRFDHMQKHCGEHILSGIFYREFGGVNRGFHMGEDYMTIDINLEENADYQEVTWEMALRAELLANQVIWRDEPVVVRYFSTRAEAEAMPLRKALAFDEDISIVCVGDPSQPSDCVACCGTHPSTAGQVGLIKIIKLENYKGMTRVYLKAGKQAFFDYVDKHEIISTLCGKLSTEPAKLVDNLGKQEEKNQQARQELAALKRSLSEAAENEIRKFYLEIKAGSGSTKKSAQAVKSAALNAVNPLQSGVSVFQSNPLSLQMISAENAKTLVCAQAFTNLKTDDLQTIGRKVSTEIQGLLILVSTVENTAVLLSTGSPDCGKFVRENASICRGKGGGNSQLARAIFTNADDLATYLDLVEKHLR